MQTLPYLDKSIIQIGQFINTHSKGKLNASSFLFSCRLDLERLAFSYINSPQLGYELDDQYKDFIQAKLNYRSISLCGFYSKINHILSNTTSRSDYLVSFLNGDSHNGGQRPVLLQNEDERLVLKITDPRTSLIYNTILYKSYENLGISTPTSRIIHDHNYNYQISPYLHHQLTNTDDKIENYALCLGAHLATSYFLQMTDLHIENVITSDGQPHVVDTECLLYEDYARSSTALDRMMNTGLVGPKKSLSGICGGESPISRLELVLNQNGSSHYCKNSATPNNRITDSCGKIVPVSKYKELITYSFLQSYKLIEHKKKDFIRTIRPSVLTDVRTRYLVRTTAHYKTVMDRMYSPSQSSPHDLYLDSTISAFQASGHIPKAVDPKLINLEIVDLLAGDIPFFWACPKGRKILHRSGRAMSHPTLPPFKCRLEKSISTHSTKDLESLLDYLHNYL
jgi:lantibiotic modifying enzyme